MFTYDIEKMLFHGYIDYQVSTNPKHGICISLKIKNLWCWNGGGRKYGSSIFQQKHVYFKLCVLYNKIPRGENFKKKSMIGPGWYVSCNNYEESMDHLILSCHFVIGVWNLIKSHLGFVQS